MNRTDPALHAPADDLASAWHSDSDGLAAATGRGTRIRVFVIDEHRLVRDGIRLNLCAASGFEVVGEASSATATAISQARDKSDVVLMNIGAHELKGDDNLEAVVAQLGVTPLILLSWRAHAWTVRRALGVGARGYVLKEAPGEHLSEAVRTVHAGGTYLGPGVADSVFQRTSMFDDLTPRERQVLHMVGLGKSSKAIANTLQLSERTVESHRQSLKRKLQLDERASLIKFAVEYVGEV